MKKPFYIIFAIFVIGSIVSCREKEVEEVVGERVDSFAVHYFNWQFEKCLPYVTADSKKFLELEATNVSEGNVELLRAAESDATIEINGFNLEDDDNAVVNLTIHNYIAADTIGRAAKFHKSGTAEVNVVRVEGKWYVDMSRGGIRTAFQQQNAQQDHVQSQDDKSENAPE